MSSNVEVGYVLRRMRPVVEDLDNIRARIQRMIERDETRRNHAARGNARFDEAMRLDLETLNALEQRNAAATAELTEFMEELRQQERRQQGEGE